VKISIATALALICLYCAVLGLSQAGEETPTQGYWRQNRNSIATYLKAEVVPPVVFAGSSLTAAMRFHGYQQCVYNMGLIGESALTGMDVVNSGPSFPKTVFIEINFPDRASNPSLINSADSLLAREFPQFVYASPFNLLVQKLGQIYQFLRHKPSETVTGQPAAPSSARQKELEIQRGVFEDYLPPLVLANKLSEFAIKIAELERKGVRVVLIELPIHPELEGTHRATQIRAAFKEAFPAVAFIDANELARGLEIQTADGLHLNEADAMGVLGNLKRYLQSDCVPVSVR
jgi:hypothetical protein